MINTDNASTATGAILATLIAANVDYGKVLEGDNLEIGKLVAAFLVGFQGYLQNKIKGHPEKPEDSQTSSPVTVNVNPPPAVEKIETSEERKGN